MAHITKDRIRESATTTGSGAFTLAGATTGFAAFSSVCAVNDTFYYTIAHMSLTEWEVGLGTYSAANTLTRTTIIASSNAGSAVVFSAGTKDVFITAPASKFLQIDSSGSVGSFTAGTITGALTGAASSNVLKAGDTMTGTLATNIGGGATSSTKHVQMLNGTGYDLFMLPRAGAGSYNNLTQAGDAVIGYSAGAVDTGALVIGPWSASAKGIRIDSSGNVSIGVASTTYKLQVNGSFAATTKSFVIDHPTKPGKKLRYGSLEGPENGVYVRGKLKGKVIELPDYWTKLVDPDSITVQLTPIGKHQKLYVSDIKDNKVYVENDSMFSGEINCFYYVLAERVDVEKFEVEIG